MIRGPLNKSAPNDAKSRKNFAHRISEGSQLCYLHETCKTGSPPHTALNRITKGALGTRDLVPTTPPNSFDKSHHRHRRHQTYRGSLRRRLFLACMLDSRDHPEEQPRLVDGETSKEHPTGLRHRSAARRTRMSHRTSVGTRKPNCSGSTNPSGCPNPAQLGEPTDPQIHTISDTALACPSNSTTDSCRLKTNSQTDSTLGLVWQKWC